MRKLRALLAVISAFLATTATGFSQERTPGTSTINEKGESVTTPYVVESTKDIPFQIVHFREGEADAFSVVLNELLIIPDKALKADQFTELLKQEKVPVKTVEEISKQTRMLKVSMDSPSVEAFLQTAADLRDSGLCEQIYLNEVSTLDQNLPWSYSEKPSAEKWEMKNRGPVGLPRGTVFDADVDGHEAKLINPLIAGNTILIAVIDSGVDRNHIDLANRVVANPADPLNGVDDDQNGLVDDTYGWNFGDSSNNTLDTDSHGTHVAGIIAADNTSGKGCWGHFPQADILPIKITFVGNRLVTSSVLQAMEYAVARGADVVNMSFTMNQQVTPIWDVMRANQDVFFVSAAGNDGQDLAVKDCFPCEFPSRNALCVSNLTSEGLLSSDSNYGSAAGGGGEPVGAPGDRILSTITGKNQFGLKSGTSMACPLVAALVGKMKAMGFSDPTDIRRTLRDRGDFYPELQGDVAYSVNAFRSLKQRPNFPINNYKDEKVIIAGAKMKRSENYPFANFEEEGVMPDGLTPNTAFTITTAKQLAAINQPAYLDKHFLLKNNIDLSDMANPFVPIGSETAPFTGRFDGNGYAISNYQSKTGGLFGKVDQGGGIRGLQLTRARVNVPQGGSNYSGILVDTLAGVINNCSAEGQISAPVTAGGLVGQLTGYSTLISGYADVEVKAKVVGGLVGFVFRTEKIDRSFATCTLIPEEIGGGLIGSFYHSNTYAPRITQSGADCYIRARGSQHKSAAGFIGYAQDHNNSCADLQIENCFAYGTIIAENHVSGFIHNPRGCTIMNSFSSVEIIADSFSDVYGFISAKQQSVECFYLYDSRYQFPSQVPPNGQNCTLVSYLGIFPEPEEDLRKKSTFYKWDEKTWQLRDGYFPYLKDIPPLHPWIFKPPK